MVKREPYAYNLDGLPAFRTLLEGPPEDVEDLVFFDVDAAHGEANRQNGWGVLLESLAAKPRMMTDTEAVASLLRMEEARGLDWSKAERG